MPSLHPKGAELAEIRTFKQLKQVLFERGIRPRIALGQNFLLSPKTLTSIVEAAGIGKDDNVLEIGVGTGSLTGFLLEAGALVTGVDIDRRLIAIAKQQLKRNEERLRLICSDVLQKGKSIRKEIRSVIAELVVAGGYKLVANLPYNVSTPLFIEIMRSDIRPSRIVVLVQKDFAERVCSQSCRKTYSPLSVFAASFGTSRIVRTVDRNLFWPSPDVESAVLQWDAALDPPQFENEALFFKLVSTLFMQRRKKISNTMKNAAKMGVEIFGNSPVKLLERALIDPGLRAEQLKVDDFMRLYREALLVRRQ